MRSSFRAALLMIADVGYYTDEAEFSKRVSEDALAFKPHGERIHTYTRPSPTAAGKGKGKHAGSTGSLTCKMESGKVCSPSASITLIADTHVQTFNVGTGLSDKQRKNPPKIGSIIVYRFQELTRDKVPRYALFSCPIYRVY